MGCWVVSSLVDSSTFVLNDFGIVLILSVRSQFEAGVQNFWNSPNKATKIAVQHPDISSMIYRADASIYDVRSFPPSVLRSFF